VSFTLTREWHLLLPLLVITAIQGHVPSSLVDACESAKIGRILSRPAGRRLSKN